MFGLFLLPKQIFFSFGKKKFFNNFDVIKHTKTKYENLFQKQNYTHTKFTSSPKRKWLFANGTLLTLIWMFA